MTLLSDWIDDVRTSLEDYGNTITDNLTGDGATVIWKMTSPPIKTNSETVTVGGVAQTRGVNYTVAWDTGEITFTSAPGNGVAVTVQYTSVIWRNERIINGLNAGIRALPPSVYKIGQIYILLRGEVYEYDLTSATDVPAASSFSDQTIPADYNPAVARADAVKAQTRIVLGEYRPFGANQVFTPYEFFRRTTHQNIQIDMDPAVNDTLRLTYTGSFTVLTDPSQTTDVPDEFYELPVWYCLATLMDKKEARRSRFDQYSAMQNVNAVPTGTQAQTAEDYLSRFHDALARRSMRPLMAYSRRRLRGWQYEARGW